MIQTFDETTLIGQTKDSIKNSFSQVTSDLEIVAADLGQKRVSVFSPGLEDNGSPSKAGKPRVNRIEVTPFYEFKNQIDNNYSEIQAKTTQAVIRRLGLGSGKPILEDNGT